MGCCHRCTIECWHRTLQHLHDGFSTSWLQSCFCRASMHNKLQISVSCNRDAKDSGPQTYWPHPLPKFSYMAKAMLAAFQSSSYSVSWAMYKASARHLMLLGTHIKLHYKCLQRFSLAVTAESAPSHVIYSWGEVLHVCQAWWLRIMSNI